MRANAIKGVQWQTLHETYLVVPSKHEPPLSTTRAQRSSRHLWEKARAHIHKFDRACQAKCWRSRPSNSSMYALPQDGLYCREGGGAAIFFARSVPEGRHHGQRLGERCHTDPPNSNVISKNVSVLETHLEITEASPDKAGKPKRTLVSKSPKIFASGGAATVTFRFPSRRSKVRADACWYFCWYLLKHYAGKPFLS